MIETEPAVRHGDEMPTDTISNWDHEQTPTEIEENFARNTTRFRKLRMYASRIALCSSVALTTVALQNADNYHIIRGFEAKGPMAIPEVDDCSIPKPESTSVPDSNTPEQSTSSNTSVITSDDIEVLASQKTSAARNGGNIFKIFEIAPQYYDYFDRPITEYTSPISGIEYRFYSYNNQEIDIDVTTLPELEKAAFHPNISYTNPQNSWATDCMSEYLFTHKRASGKVLPIVIAGESTCLQDGVIVDISKDCHGSAFAWPKADFRIWPFDITPYDEFILLTPGDADNGDAHIRNSLFVHELAHKQAEWVQGSDYRFQLDPEEKFAELLELKAKSIDTFENIPPLITTYTN